MQLLNQLNLMEKKDAIKYFLALYMILNNVNYKNEYIILMTH